MSITKSAQQQSPFQRTDRFFPSARAALGAFLGSQLQCGETVLLPAYIGWSVREGSGVYDPIRELGLRPAFYRVTENLWIDIQDLQEKLDQTRARVLILIHYFGYVDPSYCEAVAAARSRGVLVIEDEAHSMLTDLVGGRTGHLGDVSIFSLPKLLPVPYGGLLRVRKDREELIAHVVGREPNVPLPWEFDLAAISERRRRNTRLLGGLLESLDNELSVLRGVPDPGIVPQTVPVLLHRAPRDRVYEVMNQAGFGVVSLYYQLIEPILPDEFPVSHFISRRILNLPVHQDVPEQELESLVRALSGFLQESEKSS